MDRRYCSPVWLEGLRFWSAGKQYKAQPAVFRKITALCFYPKQITTGGRLIVTGDDQANAMMRAMRNQAAPAIRLQHTYLGYNYRLDEMSATLGRVQMGRLDELLAKRQRVAGWYAERLAEIPGVEPPQVVPSTTRVSWFVYVVRFDPRIDRDAVAQALSRQGVPARPYFLPIHLQPYMVERFGCKPGDYPVTEDLGRRSLALPFSGVMSEVEVEYVCQSLRQALRELGNFRA
jgi:dTDP-4-amino-4,6-dideoxygalactose transaminase